MAMLYVIDTFSLIHFTFQSMYAIIDNLSHGGGVKKLSRIIWIASHEKYVNCLLFNVENAKEESKQEKLRCQLEICLSE